MLFSTVSRSYLGFNALPRILFKSFQCMDIHMEFMFKVYLFKSAPAPLEFSIFFTLTIHQWFLFLNLMYPFYCTSCQRWSQQVTFFQCPLSYQQNFPFPLFTLPVSHGSYTDFWTLRTFLWCPTRTRQSFILWTFSQAISLASSNSLLGFCSLPPDR